MRDIEGGPFGGNLGAKMELELESEDYGVLSKLQKEFGGRSSDSGSDSDDPGSPVAVASDRSASLKRSPTPQSSDDDVSPPTEEHATNSGQKRMHRRKSSSKNAVNQIHRDAQKVVRESSLNLPKYKPRPKTLNSFLTRLRSRGGATVSKPHLHSRSVDKENMLSNHTPLSTGEEDLSPPAPFEKGVVEEERLSATPPCEMGAVNEEGSTNSSSPKKLKRNKSNSSSPLNLGGVNSNPSKLEGNILKEGRSKAPRKPKSHATRPEQRTLTSLFAVKPNPFLPDDDPPAAAQAPPQPQPPQIFPPESEDGLCFDVPCTNLEKFQHTLTRQITATQSHDKSAAASTSVVGVASNLSDETIAKLKDKPGAARVEWKLAMRKQVSHICQERAEGQRLLEKEQKMYEEEEEEEEEMTDGDTTDTSDEEFVEKEEVDGEGSDLCSDLDEDESIHKDSGKEEEGYLSQLRLTKKKSRALDSDEDDEDEKGVDTVLREGVSGSNGGMPPLRLDSASSEASMTRSATTTNDVDDDGDHRSTSLEDSGVAITYQDQTDRAQIRSSALSEEGSVASSTADGDSLELSLQWSASLPLAQVSSHHLSPSGKKRRKEYSPLQDSTQYILEEEAESQWQATPTNEMQSQLISQGIEEETQFLDADGFLCIRKEKLNSPGLALWGAMDPTQEGSPGELLHLCSGRFPDATAADGGGGVGEQKRTDNKTSSQQMRELLGLSLLEYSSDDDDSDTDKPSSTHAPSLQAKEEKLRASVDRSEDGEGGNAVLRWAQRNQEGLGVGRQGEGKREDTTSEVTVGKIEIDDDDMPFIRKRRIQVKQTNGERLAEFVESEAELSGDDMGSDLDEEDLLYADEYEEEENTHLTLTESQLRDQVNKAHMKHTLADDKVDLKNFKERFLKEGDLYEDGLALKNGFFRSRRFAAQGSEAGSVELFSEERESGGEGEGEETGNHGEAKRRRDRLEREEFIRKCKENEDLLELDQDSQAILSSITDTTTSRSHLSTPTPTIVSRDTPSNHMPSSGRRRSHCNSFLKRIKSTPSALQSSNSQSSTPSIATPTNIGASSNRGFVFQKSTPVPRIDLSSGKRQRPGPNKLHGRGKGKGPSAPKKPHLNRTYSLPHHSTNSRDSVFSLY